MFLHQGSFVTQEAFLARKQQGVQGVQHRVRSGLVWGVQSVGRGGGVHTSPHFSRAGPRKWTMEFGAGVRETNENDTTYQMAKESPF